jgi:hypothetical protein
MAGDLIKRGVSSFSYGKKAFANWKFSVPRTIKKPWQNQVNRIFSNKLGGIQPEIIKSSIPWEEETKKPRKEKFSRDLLAKADPLTPKKRMLRRNLPEQQPV